MKKRLLIFVLSLSGLSIFAQTDDRIARTNIPLSLIEQITLPPLDNQALLAAELERRRPGIAPRFAIDIQVDISPDNHGHWETLPNGYVLWRLRILSKGAKSLNLGFTRYAMPPGGTMILYSTDYQNVMGPFTPADNEKHEQLWTPVLPGDELVVEVQLPPQSRPALQLELKYVNHDFLGFTEIVSGSCNLDVTCGAADGWAIVDQYRDVIQSVAVIGTNGNTYCSGFLVNNARQDCTPYFMTGFHCGINTSNAPSLIAYWNFSNSTCRQPNSPASGGPGNGLLNDFNTGAVFRAGWSNSDFTLLELDDPVSETANAFFAGWNAEHTLPFDTIACIHHPLANEKRISFEFDPTYTGTWGAGNNSVPDGDHIIIPDWDIGTTEDASSGAPLFNNRKQVVGQLHGGVALCGNDGYDLFGRFYSSWEGGGTAGTRLRDWLDPDHIGLDVLDGRSQAACDYFVRSNPQTVDLCFPENAVYRIAVSENFTDSVVLSVKNVPSWLAADFDADVILPGDSTILTIANTGSLAPGVYPFDIAASDGVHVSLLTLFLRIQFGEITLLSPENNSSGTILMPEFTWSEMPSGSYTLQIATDENFVNLVESVADLTTNSYKPAQALDASTLFFWRVKVDNDCGEVGWSSTHSFLTGIILCTIDTAVEVPVNISPAGKPVITSTIEVTNPGLINDLDVVGLTINHTFVGDLWVELTSPAGTTITLMSNPQDGVCQGDNIELFFNDQSSNAYSVLDATCNNIPPAILGEFQPLTPLSFLNGEPAAGVWTLTVHDDNNEDGGALTGWGLAVCSAIQHDFFLFSSVESLTSCAEEEANFNIQVGAAFDGTYWVNLSAGNLPAGVMAGFEPNPAPPGTTVQVKLIGASMPGDFSLVLTGTDSVHTESLQLEWTVVENPSAPVLLAPLAAAENVSINPAFSWNPVSGASSYHFELAADENFTTLLADETLSQPFFNLPSPLDNESTYHWRVTAFNQCGGVTSTPFYFMTEPVNAIRELEDIALTVTPNPTNGLLSVSFSEPVQEEMEVALYSPPGVLLKRQVILPGQTSFSVELGTLQGGIYLLKVRSSDAKRIERIVLLK